MKKIIFIILAIIVTIYLFIEIIGDSFVKSSLEKNISSSLGREVKIESLNIKYLNGEASAKNISLLNKNFPGYLLKINNIKVKLDTSSIFTNDIIIKDVLLKDINVNYYFDFVDQSITDNIRPLQKELNNKSSTSTSSKFFNIENLNAENITLSAISPNLNFDKQINLSDLNFTNIGNKKESKNYKDELKIIFYDIVSILRENVLNNSVMEKIETLKEDILNKNIEEQIDKGKKLLKDKLKKLIK